MRLATIQREQTAVELIRRGMRISVVSRITDFSPQVLRSLSRQIHGQIIGAGPLPSSGRMLIKRATQATASLFAALYRIQGGSGIFDAINLEALLSAHAFYLELSKDLSAQGLQSAPIDITRAWILARDLRTGVAFFRYCRSCRIHYLYTEDLRVPSGCPVCTLKRQDAARTRQGR